MCREKATASGSDLGPALNDIVAQLTAAQRGAVEKRAAALIDDERARRARDGAGRRVRAVHRLASKGRAVRRG